MDVFTALESLIKFAVGAIIALMVLRFVISWLGVNPFSWFAYQVHRLTEPLVRPFRHTPFALHTRRDIAPLLAIILVLIVAYFLLGLLGQARSATGYMLKAMGEFAQGNPLTAVRYVLGATALALISLVITCIILEVIFSWVGFYGNWLTRMVRRVSEPVLGPFRRMIPPVLGTIDISPLIAILVLSLVSSAVRVIFLS